ncbi:hypothetical protein TNCV_4464731 [Trichonephila clavipes]|nr:hypothetical protein TNCV_4464731 [Trichonephila clavipes]
MGRLESRRVADAVGAARSVVARLWNFHKMLDRPGAGRHINDRYIRLTAHKTEQKCYAAALLLAAAGRRMIMADRIENNTAYGISVLSDLNQSSMFGTYSDDALLREQGHLLLSRLGSALLEVEQYSQSLIDNLIAFMANSHIKSMFDPSSFANPTSLAHADTSRDVLPRGGTSQEFIQKSKAVAFRDNLSHKFSDENDEIFGRHRFLAKEKLLPNGSCLRSSNI